MRSLLFTLMLLISTNSWAQSDDMFAVVAMQTSMGYIKMRLFKQEAPRTVENFLGLATGRKKYRDSKTGLKVENTPFYRDMIFHKIHPELAIQTGCPWGNGKGWPGFTIKYESNGLKFDRPFLVAMSRTAQDPNSVGSQFFITTAPTPHLDSAYTVIGEVIEGHDVVQKISMQKRDALMKPLKPIKLIEVIVESE